MLSSTKIKILKSKIYVYSYVSMCFDNNSFQVLFIFNWFYHSAVIDFFFFLFSFHFIWNWLTFLSLKWSDFDEENGLHSPVQLDWFICQFLGKIDVVWCCDCACDVKRMNEKVQQISFFLASILGGKNSWALVFFLSPSKMYVKMIKINVCDAISCGFDILL